MHRELLFQGVIGTRLHGLPGIVDGNILRRITNVSRLQKLLVSLFVVFMYVVNIALIRLSATLVHGLGSTSTISKPVLEHIVGQLSPLALSSSYPLTVFSYTLSILLIDTLQLLYSIRGTYFMDFFLVLPVDRRRIQSGLIKSTLKVMDVPLAVNVVMSVALSFLVSSLSPLITAAAIIYAVACFYLAMMLLSKTYSSSASMLLVSAVMIGFLIMGSFLPLIMMEYSSSISIFLLTSFPSSLVKYLPVMDLVAAELDPSMGVLASIAVYSVMAMVAASRLFDIDYRSIFIEEKRGRRGGSMKLKRRSVVISMLIKELKSIYRSSRLLMMVMVPIAYGVISLVMVLIVPYRSLSPRFAFMSIMPFELMMSIVTVMIVYLSYIVDFSGYYLLKMLPLGKGRILESKMLLSVILYIAFTSPLLFVLVSNELMGPLFITILEVVPILIGVIVLNTTINSFMKNLTMGTLPLFMMILIGMAVLAAVVPLISASVLLYVTNERMALVSMGLLSAIELALVLIANVLE